MHQNSKVTKMALKFKDEGRKCHHHQNLIASRFHHNTYSYQAT